MERLTVDDRQHGEKRSCLRQYLDTIWLPEVLKVCECCPGIASINALTALEQERISMWPIWGLKMRHKWESQAPMGAGLTSRVDVSIDVCVQ
ncbi:hypothetical protein SE17_07070 [Kouleothrix aurantiaca]|uniref:Uncharacterized protein n=1 Tax=Kouleothrix aurantiaca TaxID=186479 RepID=A0A0P9DDT3_9CHLR|nr:hypothetical protein SE17_07070 [Kouleothrix aurantiaca]